MNKLGNINRVIVLSPDWIPKFRDAFKGLTDAESEDFAIQITNRQIELFGLTHREAFMSMFLLSRGVQLCRSSYTWILEDAESTELLVSPRSFKYSRYSKSKDLNECIQLLTSEDFVSYELPVGKGSERSRVLQAIDKKFRNAWGTSCKYTPGYHRPEVLASECGSKRKFPAVYSGTIETTGIATIDESLRRVVVPEHISQTEYFGA